MVNSDNSLFDLVTANRHILKHRIAAIGLAAYVGRIYGIHISELKYTI